MKLRSPTKIAFSFVALVAISWFGCDRYAAYRVDRLHFPEIAPGQVNLVAVTPGAGYRIIVSNGLAQLAEVSNQGFDAPDIDQNSEADASNKKRIPIREMLQTLQGNEEALGKLIMALNDISESNLPPIRNVWQAESIRAALDGNAKLAAKLERELNLKLDGMPLPFVSKSAIYDGIVVSSPVPISLLVGNSRRTLVGRVYRPFRARLMRAVEKHLEEKNVVTDAMIQGYYREEGSKVLSDPKNRENLKLSLSSLIDPKRLADLALAPEKVLSNTKVIINERHIRSVDEPREIEGPNNRKLYDLTLHLSEEGRNRLWQYSRGRKGFQLLWIVDGIAIAAPKISHELAQPDVSITQLPDITVLNDAVEEIRKLTHNGGDQS